MEIAKMEGEFDYIQFFSDQFISPHGKYRLEKIWKAFEEQREFSIKIQFIYEYFSKVPGYEVVDIRPISDIGFVVKAKSTKGNMIYTHASEKTVCGLYWVSEIKCLLDFLCREYSVPKENVAKIEKLFGNSVNPEV